MKKLLALIMLFCAPLVYGEDISWETGTLNGWTVGGGSTAGVKSTGWSANGGGVAVSGGLTNYTPGGGKTWNISPYGTYMGSLQPGGGAVAFDSATSSLGLTGTENTAIKTYLSYQATHGGGGSPTPTNATWIKQTVTLTAGSTYTIAWNYLSTDYTPWNDGSMMTLVHSTNANITPVLNNSQQRYALLGFTNPGTGNYATGSYGSTGWQVATFAVPETGDYVLGFASFNLGDTALSPILFVDQVQGSTTLNGQTFAPVAPNAGSTAPVTPPSGGSSLCCGGSSTSFEIDADKAASISAFVNRTTQDSKVFIDQIGSSNTITVQQTGTKNNYAEYNGNGSSNNITITQSGDATTTANYVKLNVTGNSNAVDITQTSTGGTKSTFASIANNNNDVTILQKDNGSHHVDLTLSGGSKTVDITQQGSGAHRADVTLTGAATGFTLQQSGSTQQFYSIQHNCSSSCSPISVTQGQ